MDFSWAKIITRLKQFISVKVDNKKSTVDLNLEDNINITYNINANVVYFNPDIQNKRIQEEEMKKLKEDVKQLKKYKKLNNE